MKKKFNFNRIYIMDDVFTFSEKWLKHFSKRYKKEINLPISVISHPTYLSEEIIKILKDCNCWQIEIGIQSFNMRIKRNILKRFEKNDRVFKIFEWCNKYKIQFKVDHIFGLPTETEEDMYEAARLYSIYKPLRITMYPLSYFPKTEIINIAKLDSKTVEDIEEGRQESYVSASVGSTNENDLILIKNYKVFFKLVTILPTKVLLYILKSKIYKKLHKLPFIFIINILILIKCRNFKFFNYIGYYLKIMPIVLFEKIKCKINELYPT